MVLHATDGSTRYSNDFDVFHESVGDVTLHSEQDVKALESAGFAVEKIERAKEWHEPASFRKAILRKGTEKTGT